MTTYDRPPVVELVAPTTPDPTATSWEDSALCAQVDPEIFFPERGEPTTAAKQTCQKCDVRAACLQAALDRQEEWGIWGGLAPRERRKLLRAGAWAEAA